MIQPRAGVAILEEHIKLLQYLEKAGADFSSFNNRFLHATKSLF